MNTDERMKELYAKAFDGIHVSSEYSRKVSNMAETKKKKVRTTVKVLVAIAVVAAFLAVAGTAIASTTRGVYEKVIFNGEERNARFCDFGYGVREWEIMDNGNIYTVFIEGDFDTEKDTLYFVDKGDYFLASTDPNPTLNLYDEIDNTSHAKFIEYNGETWLAYNTDENIDELGNSYSDKDNFSEDGKDGVLDEIEYDPFLETWTLPPSCEIINFSEDGKDGVLDGKFVHDDTTCETWTLLPNGTLVNTIKTSSVPAIYNDKMEEMWEWLWSLFEPSVSDNGVQE